MPTTPKPTSLKTTAEEVVLGDIVGTPRPTAGAAGGRPNTNNNNNNTGSNVRVASSSPNGAPQNTNDADPNTTDGADLASLTAEAARTLRPPPPSVMNAVNTLADEMGMGGNGGGPRSFSQGSTHSNSSSCASSDADAKAEQRYSFAALCAEEEQRIASRRRAIRARVEAAVKAELLSMGPVTLETASPSSTSNAGAATRGVSKSHTDDGKTVVSVSSTAAGDAASSSTAATTTVPDAPIDVVKAVAMDLTAIGDGIARERRRIHTTALRQHRRYQLASQGLAAGGHGSAANRNTAKSAARQALAAKKHLNDSSEFVECTSAALSLSSIVCDTASSSSSSSVDYLCNATALTVLKEFAEILDISVKTADPKCAGVSLAVTSPPSAFASPLSTKLSPTNSKSAGSSVTPTDVASSVQFLGVPNGLTPNVSVSSATADQTILELRTLVHNAVTFIKDRPSGAAAVLAVPPNLPDDTEVLASISSLHHRLATRLELSPFSAFALGKELFLRSQQLQSSSSASSTASPTALKEAFLTLLSANVLLTFAADTTAPTTGSGAVGAETHIDPTSMMNGGGASAEDDVMAEDGTSKMVAKPSHLTPFPKAFFAAEAFYYLGCCAKAMKAFSKSLLMAASRNSGADASSATAREFKAYFAIAAEWCPYQCPAALVALATRALNRYEAQEEKKEQQQAGAADGDDDNLGGNLSLPTCITTRDESDSVFVSVVPHYCAMQCLALNEGNHGGAWQLLAEGLGATDCVEVGNPSAVTAVPPTGVTSTTASSSFLRGGATASLLGTAGGFTSPLLGNGAAVPLPLPTATSWEGAVFLGEHTKTSAYVEAIRCLGGVIGCTNALHLNTIWFPLAQSMFYSANPEIGAEEVLVACRENTWYDDPDAEVVKLDKMQILKHIIATDRVACPDAYLELGTMANMGYVMTERECKDAVLAAEVGTATGGADIADALFTDDADGAADGTNSGESAADADARKKRAADAKAAFIAARSTTNDALVAVVEELLELTDDLLPEDDAPFNTTTASADNLGAVVDAHVEKYFGGSSSATPAKFAALAKARAYTASVKSLLTDASLKASANTTANGNRGFQMLLSKKEEGLIAKHAAKLKLKVVKEEVLSIPFEPIVKPVTTPASGTTTTTGTLTGIELPSGASDGDSNKKSDSAATSTTTYPPPLTLRKMDCLSLALSLDPRNSKVWLRIALGLEDRSICRVNEKLSTLDASAEVCNRLLAVNELKRRFFAAAEAKEKAAGKIDPDADVQQSTAAATFPTRGDLICQWATEVFPCLLQTLIATTAPSAEAKERAELLAYGPNTTAQFTSFATAVQQYDPLVYERTVIGGGNVSADVTVTRVEALMRALAYNNTDSRTWFVLGTTLADRYLLKEKMMQEWREAEGKKLVAASCADSESNTTNNAPFKLAVAASFAHAKANATTDRTLATNIRMPKDVLPPGALSPTANADDDTDDLAPITATECFKAALVLAKGTPGATSTRSMVLQWCRKNGYPLDV